MSNDYRLQQKWRDLQRKNDRLRKQSEQQGTPKPQQQPSTGYAAPERRRAS